MGDLHATGKAIMANLDHGHQIKSEESQIIQIVCSKIFTQEVCMHKSQSPQTTRPPSEAADLGNRQLFSTSDDYVSDVPISAEQHAHLTTELTGKGGQVLGQFKRDDLAGIHSPAVGSLQRLDQGVLDS